MTAEALRRRSRSTEGRNPYSRGEYGCGDTGPVSTRDQPHRATERRLVADPADDNHIRRLVSSRRLTAVNPPCMALPCCPPLCTRGAAASRRWQNFLCPGEHNRPWFCCRARERSMTAEALRRRSRSTEGRKPYSRGEYGGGDTPLPGAGAQYDSGGTPPPPLTGRLFPLLLPAPLPAGVPPGAGAAAGSGHKPG